MSRMMQMEATEDVISRGLKAEVQVDNILCLFLYFFRSDLVRNQLFRPRIAVNAIFFSSLVNKQLFGGLAMVCGLSSLVSNQFQKW